MSYRVVSCHVGKGHTHVCVSNHMLAFGYLDSSINHKKNIVCIREEKMPKENESKQRGGEQKKNDSNRCEY